MNEQAKLCAQGGSPSEKAFRELQPTLDDLARLIAQVPLSADHRAGVATMVLVYFAGIVRAAFREASKPITAEAIAGLVEFSLSDEPIPPEFQQHDSTSS